MFSPQTDHIANAAKMLTASAAFAAGPSVKTATSVYDAARKLFKTPPPGLHSMSIEVTALANEAFEGFRHDLPDDADIRFEQMIAATLPDAETITKAGMKPNKLAQAMRAQLSDPDHLAPPMPQLLEDIVTPVFARLFADKSFADDLTPAFMAQLLGETSEIGSDVKQIKEMVRALERNEVSALSRDQLKLLASRFEIETPHALSDEKLRDLLTQKAEEYRTYRDQIDALDDRIAGVHNLKAAAQDAAERLDFDEVETLLARVDMVETEIMAETKEARAANALLRNRADQAYAIFTAAAESFRELDILEMARRRDRYRRQLYVHGLRYGGTGLAHAIDIQHPGIDALQDTEYQNDWASFTQNLGNALCNQGIRTAGRAGIDLLIEAIAAYRDALTVFTHDDHPAHWAMTTQNLANALCNQGIRTAGRAGIDLLIEAIAAYRDALTVRTRDDHPLDWAATTQNLGNALRNQGTRTAGRAGTELLIEAVAAYRDALTVFTREDHPTHWAMTTQNLGNALRHQGIRTAGRAGTELLIEAIAAYRDALTVRTREDHPLDWAKTTQNLGNALRHQGIRTASRAGTELLIEAVAAYHDALTVYTHEDQPGQWAMTTQNIAIAKLDIAKHPATEDPRLYLDAALSHVDAALTIYDPEHMSYSHAKATRLRDDILTAIDALP